MEDKTLRAAGFFPRLAAFLLDRLILGVCLFIPRLFLLFGSIGEDPLSRAVLFRYSWGDIVLWALAAAYFILFTALSGSTPGKKAMGLTVVSSDGSRPDLMTVVSRETFARYLSGVILCIGYLLCLVDPEQGALHDRICDTRVVYAPEKAPRQKALPTAPRRPVAVSLPEGGADWYAPNRK